MSQSPKTPTKRIQKPKRGSTKRSPAKTTPKAEAAPPPPRPRLAQEGPGQPPLDPLAYVDKVCGLVRRGNYIETAAAFAGISKDTLYAWLKRAHTDEPDGVYRQFSDALTIALAEAEVRDLQNLDKFGEKNWNVIAWKMERRHPRKWGRLDRIEHAGAEGGPIKIAEMSQEALEAELALLEAKLRDDPDQIKKA